MCVCACQARDRGCCWRREASAGWLGWNSRAWRSARRPSHVGDRGHRVGAGAHARAPPSRSERGSRAEEVADRQKSRSGPRLRAVHAPPCASALPTTVPSCPLSLHFRTTDAPLAALPAWCQVPGTDELVTKEALEEEARLAAEREAAGDEGGTTEHLKRGQFDKLTDLLDRSQMYTEFLGERMTEIEEADKKNARAQHDERPPSRASCRRPAAARGCSRREGRRSTPPSDARRAASCVLRLRQCALVSSELQYKW